MTRRGLIAGIISLPLAGFSSGERLGPNNLGCRIGRVSQWLSPGFSWCEHCKTTWNWVWGHSTAFLWCKGEDLTPDSEGRFSGGSGMFPLCELCWRELTPETRLPYYLKVNASWSPPMPESMIRRSVLREGQGPEPGSPRSYVNTKGETIYTNSFTRLPDEPVTQPWWCQ